MSNTRNLTPGAFTPLEWSKDTDASQLDELAAFVSREAERASHWYYQRKGRKAFGGQLLRVCAILATTTAGVIPILGEIFESSDGEPLITGGWSAIALALAGLFVLLDRFWGFTRAWVRYIQTGQALTHHLDAFRLDFEAQRTEWESNQPTEEQTQAAIALCRKLLVTVHELVRKETNEWATEFQGALAQIEASEKPKDGGQ